MIFSANHYTSTYFILSRLSDRLIFRNFLFRAGILEKKNEYVSQHTIENVSRVSTCIIHVQLAESRPECQCLVSNK